MTTLDAALAYAARGWKVLPVEPKGKRPILANWPAAATDDPDTIRRFWQQTPDANVGLAAGQRSGFDVLDVDGDAGRDTLQQLEAEHGQLPDTVEAITGGGGRHILFAHHDGLRNAVRFLPGLDVRTDGGQIVVEPSTHPSGRPYTWDLAHHPESSALAPWPDWLLLLATGPTKAPESPAQPAEAGNAPKAEEGTRNAYLASRAGAMRRAGFHQSEIEAALLVVNLNRCNPPLPKAEVRAVAASVAKYDPKATADPTTPADPPRFLSIPDLASMAEEEVAWIVPDFLAVGEVTGLVGREKSGKTTLLYALLAAAERAAPFLDRTTVAATAVILSEEPAAIVLGRAKRFGLEKAHVLPRHGLHRIAGITDRLKAACECAAKIGAGIIVLDSFAKVASLVEAQENDAGAVQATFDAIHACVPPTLATVVVHHAAKGEKTGTDLARGSTAFVAALDTFLAFRKPAKGTAERIVEFTGRHMDYPDPLRIELRQNVYWLVEDKFSDTFNAAWPKIVAAIRKAGGGAPKATLAATFGGASECTVRRVLDRAVREEFLTESGKGVKGTPRTYHLTEKGVSYA